MSATDGSREMMGLLSNFDQLTARLSLSSVRRIYQSGDLADDLGNVVLSS